MNYLLIQPSPGDADRASWLLYAEDKPGEMQTGSLEQAIESAAGYPVILLAPGERILLTSTELAIKQTAKLRKAVPYALEDQLSEDVEDLHFALGPRIESRQTVAVIERSLLEYWLERFSDHHLTPRAVVPDILMLPWQDGSWFVGIDEQRALIRTGQATGFSCEPENLQILLEAALAEVEEQPSSIHLWQCGGSATLPGWSSESPKLVRHRCNGSLLQLLAQGIDLRNTINLLQGEYSTQTDLIKGLKPWRWAAGLVLILFGLGYTSNLIERKQLENQRSQLIQQSEQIYRKTFPGVKKVVNPRVQMEQRLKQLRGGDTKSQSPFLELLTRSGKIISTTPKVKLEGLRFRNRQLDLKVSAATLSALDALKTRMQNDAALNTELLNADSGQGKATGTLRIKAQ